MSDPENNCPICYGRPGLDCDHDLVAELRASLRREARLREALTKYARRFEDSKHGKVWNWNPHVCDSYSGESWLFDWLGEEQDEPWEVAEKALAFTGKDKE